MERKVVSVLFADIVGSTAIGERHDPELVQSIIGPAFERLSAEVRRYEGLIEKFVGDAVLALFGVPITHEDDAERSVRAALEMQRVMREIGAEITEEGAPRLQLRIGIERGEVLVDLERTGRERDRMVTGDTVNLAARLEQAASPGTVVVGPSLHAATRDRIAYEPIERIQVKGKAEPVRAWRPVAIAANLSRRSPFGRESPLVGREAELAALKEAVAASEAVGRPRLVTILGAAGVGKSRLGWELEKHVDGLPEPYLWRKGRCLAYGQASYSALSDALKSDIGVRDDDSPERASATMERRLADLGLTGAAAPIRAALRATLGLEDSPGLSREDLFEAWRRYLEVVARSRPLVLVLEDLHWADEGLLDFVEFLGRWSEAPIAIVCLARHELIERRPAWGESVPGAMRVVVEPLTTDEIGILVGGLVGASLGDDVVARVASTSEGNPLFAEELARLVQDLGDDAADPATKLAVPDSINALLAARLDNLPAAERRLARDAAVIGRFFWDGALAHLDGTDPAVVAGRLSGLQAKELVISREPSSLSGEAEFGFRHVLIRDVGYEGLPKRERAVKHRLVAEWAEGRFADRPDEVVELIASHYSSALAYEQALQTGPADGLALLRGKVLEFARRAGRRSTVLWQLETGTRWMRLAVEQGRRLQLPTQDLAALILEYLEASSGHEAVDRLMSAADEALGLLEPHQDRDGAPRAGESVLRARIAIVKADAHYFAGEPERARATLDEALARLEGEPPTAERARVLARLGRMLNVTGGEIEARPYLRRAVEEAHTTGDAESERWALHDLGLFNPNEAEALDLMERSLELARAGGDWGLLARCYTNLPSVIGDVRGDWHRAMAICRDGIEHAERAGDLGTLGRVRENLAAFVALVGPLDEALRLAETGFRESAELGHEAHVTSVFRDLAYIRLAMGDLQGAAADLERTPHAGQLDQPGVRSEDAYVRSLVKWSGDPEGAAQDLMDFMTRFPDDDTSGQCAKWLVRMAGRTRQTEAGEVGLEQQRAREATNATPLRRLWRAWAEALLVAPAGAGAGALMEVADELHSMEYGLPAADALADAALLAARAGLPSDRIIARATTLYVDAHAVPILGPMPESRWIGSGDGD